MFITSNCVDGETGIDEGRCVDPSHIHSAIYCMWHGQTYAEHVVGAMCILDKQGGDGCGKQWFYEPDWSTSECRRLREWERKHLWRTRLNRILNGWKWRNALTYQP